MQRTVAALHSRYTSGNRVVMFKQGSCPHSWERGAAKLCWNGDTYTTSVKWGNCMLQSCGREHQNDSSQLADDLGADLLECRIGRPA